MKKRFYQLKVGDLFIWEGWDLMKIGPFTARTAHSDLCTRIRRYPWNVVITIKTNPNCNEKCLCKHS